MPTVLEENGFQVRIYLPPREHQPPHVHVVKAGTEVVVRLGDSETPPQVAEVYGMHRADVMHAYRIVEANQAMLLQKWRQHHG
ncbi:MAG: DUF4160 domain-containing protein [Gemmatimonadota bacterium]|nr:DUF4160 domain-containing protein [Gemmatimonadota bacterium]